MFWSQPLIVVASDLLCSDIPGGNSLHRAPEIIDAVTLWREATPSRTSTASGKSCEKDPTVERVDVSKQPSFEAGMILFELVRADLRAQCRWLCYLVGTQG